MGFAARVTAVSTAIDQLTHACPDTHTATELRALLVELKRSASRLDAQIARVTHTADLTGAFIGTGARDTAEWLAGQTGTSVRRNRTAAELGEAMAHSDHLTAAVITGSISTDKAAVAVGAAGGEAIDAELLDAIVDAPLNTVKPTVERWRARRNPDRDTDIADLQRARRYIRLTSQADGMTRLDGLLDPESGAIVRSTLDGIMNHTHNDATLRTRDQRCHDALVQLCAAASKGEIKGGRSNTKLLATVPFDTIVERATARGITHTGTTLDAATIRKLACDAGIHRVITGPASSILDFGHETRLVPDNLFYALVTCDQHCRWPGCTIRATWCDAHHITEYTTHNGPTNDANCVLLCHRHHQLSHQPGWSITGTGHTLHINHPDGTTHTSRPPRTSTTRADPPGADEPRAGTTGREPPPDIAPAPEPGPTVGHEQLTLA